MSALEPFPDLAVIIPVAPGDIPHPQLLAALQPERRSLEAVLSLAAPAPYSPPVGFRTLVGQSGRGKQLNAGIGATQAEWLWLLHADTIVGPEALHHAEQFIRHPPPRGDAMRIGYGWLRFRRDGPPATRLNALGANLRSRLLALPYGDQGLLIHRSLLTSLGGFREDLSRGEDLDFIVRARRCGASPQAAGYTVWTSARRYAQAGWLATTWDHYRTAVRLVRGAYRSPRKRPP